ncbi:hypothetical protein ACFQ11_29255, partial [Actinomadura sediminis]
MRPESDDTIEAGEADGGEARDATVPAQSGDESGVGARAADLADGPVPGDDLSADAVAARAEETRAAGRRPCGYCGRPIARGARRDARFCSTEHRNAHNRRLRRRDAESDAPLRTLREERALLEPLVAALSERSGSLTRLLDGAVADALADAENARAEAREAHRAADEADVRARLADERAEQALNEARAAAADRDEKVRQADRRAREARRDAEHAWEEAGRAAQARQTAEEQAAAEQHLRQVAEQAAAEARHVHEDTAARLREAQAELRRLADALTAVTSERDRARADLENERRHHADASRRADRAQDDLAEARRDLDEVRERLAEADRARQAAAADAAEARGRAVELQARAERADAPVDRAADRAERTAARAD